MEYRIETKEAFRIVGVSAPLEKEIEKNFDTVPAMMGKGCNRRHCAASGSDDGQ